MPFTSIPQPFEFANNASAYAHWPFVTNELKKLIKCGLVSEICAAEAHYVNPLSVATNSTKPRLILDCSFMNKFVAKFKFKIDDLSLTIKMTRKGFRMIKFDLKSGYYHVDIHPEHQVYLGFSWFIGGKQRFFVFKVLPFGLSSGPFVFTKLLRPLVRKWRAQGILCQVYLDDGFACGSKEHMQMCSPIVLGDLTNCGFVINVDKIEFCPKLSLTYLGFIINCQSLQLSLPDCRRNAILKQLFSCLKRYPMLSARRALQIAGSIISCRYILRDLSLLKTRSFYQFVGKCVDWYFLQIASNAVWNDVSFSITHFQAVVSSSIDILPCPSFVYLSIYPDASASGGGAYFRLNDKIMHTSHVEFDHWQRGQSSTWRELFVVVFALESCAHLFTNSACVWFCDNQAVPTIIRRGSMNVDLHKMACRIFELCQRFYVDLRVSWIPPQFNVLADALSRFKDWYDSGICGGMFRFLCQKWSPCTLDGFANSRNAQLPRFYSLSWNPRTLGCNAFNFSWADETVWVVPPFRLIAQCLLHFSRTGTHMILMVPYWPSANFWPLLLNGPQHGFVILDTYTITQAKRYILPGLHRSRFLATQPDIAFVPVAPTIISNRVRYDKFQDFSLSITVVTESDTYCCEQGSLFFPQSTTHAFSEGTPYVLK